MAEKLVTRELGSRWVPHPASDTASTENEPLAPRRPAAAARASFPLKLVFEAGSPPGRLPARASRRTRERETRPSARGSTVQAAPLVAASLPHPNRPRPSPQGPARGRAAATGLHNPARGGGRGGGRRPPAVRGTRPWPPRVPGRRSRRAVWPSAPFPPSAPQPAGVGDRNRLPTWRTGSGPARRREHSSLAGSEESGPGAPASGGASRADCRARRPTGAVRGGNDPRDEGVPAAPQTASPKATGGLGLAGEGGRFLASAQPGSAPPAGSRDTTRARIH